MTRTSQVHHCRDCGTSAAPYGMVSFPLEFIVPLKFVPEFARL